MSAHTAQQKYTDPELRERLKEQIKAGDKGGNPGEWSARKSQLLVHEYEKAGGGYTTDERDDAQEHLHEWSEQEWQTRDGDTRARHEDGTTERYLPKAAWEELSEAEKNADEKQKRTASKHGEQHVPNTGAAKEAVRHATHHEAK